MKTVTYELMFVTKHRLTQEQGMQAWTLFDYFAAAGQGRGPRTYQVRGEAQVPDDTEPSVVMKAAEDRVTAFVGDAVVLGFSEAIVTPYRGE